MELKEITQIPNAMLYLLFIATVSYPPHLHTGSLDIVSKYVLGKVPYRYFVGLLPSTWINGNTQ